MGEVVQLDDRRPHLTITVDQVYGQDPPEVHVIPVALVFDWALGKVPLPQESLVRKMIGEWAMCVSQGYHALAQQEILDDDP